MTLITVISSRVWCLGLLFWCWDGEVLEDSTFPLHLPRSQSCFCVYLRGKSPSASSFACQFFCHVFTHFKLLVTFLFIWKNSLSYWPFIVLKSVINLQKHVLIIRGELNEISWPKQVCVNRLKTRILIESSPYWLVSLDE